VHLHADDFWHYICQGRIAPYLPQAHQQNQTVIDALAQAASAYAAGGFQVICDGIVGPWFIDVFRIAATARVIPLHYVILRPDQATALRRAVSRTDHVLTDPEPIRSLHRQFTDIGAYEKHVLDSTRLSPQATADTVLHGRPQEPTTSYRTPRATPYLRGHHRHRPHEGHHPAGGRSAAAGAYVSAPWFIRRSSAVQARRDGEAVAFPRPRRPP